MTAIGWDSPRTASHLLGLYQRQVRSHIGRMLARLRSPQRMLASAIAITCIISYGLAGLTILAQRDAIDADRLRMWVSGSMVIYSLHHLTRSIWTSRDSTEPVTSRAVELWLGGAPLERSSLIGFERLDSVVQSLVKAGLIWLVLVHDVSRPELLFMGMFASILLLEWVRPVIDNAIALLSRPLLYVCRIASIAMVCAVAVTVITRVMTQSPASSPTMTYLLGSIQALGDVASSSFIQTLALPWLIATSLAVSDGYSGTTMLQFAGTVCLAPLTLMLLCITDRIAIERRERDQVSLPADVSRHTQRLRHSLDRFNHALASARGWALAATTDQLPGSMRPATMLAWRQSISLRKRSATFVCGLVVPAILSLSPLLAGDGMEQWLFVIGGVTLSTLLLAPSAIRLDFRRDLRRLTLLKGLPMTPRAVVAGQLAIPIGLTIAFQWSVLGIAAWITQPELAQVILWCGLMPPFALAVFAFENAVFLLFPHAERAEGVAMLVRTKVVFLAKSLVLIALLSMLLAWATLCRAMLPPTMLAPLFVGSSIAIACLLSLAAFAVTVITWRRYDCCADAPLGT